jgi:signal transduction histidine kinase
LAENLVDSLRGTNDTEAQKARRIALGLRQALSQVRSLSRGLIPVEVDAEGLMAALAELTNRISDLHAVQCVFECLEPVPVEDNQTATHLYRIAQEAITNALKHGQAANLRVSLEAHGHYITLKIADDGVGIPSADEITEGMGLRIMRYRAGQIGAHLTVRAEPTGGTVVTCTLYRGTSHE